MTRCILYVEDDPTEREVAPFNLRRAGYDVTPASDGQEALSRFPPESSTSSSSTSRGRRP